MIKTSASLTITKFTASVLDLLITLVVINQSINHSIMGARLRKSDQQLTIKTRG